MSSSSPSKSSRAPRMWSVGRSSHRRARLIQLSPVDRGWLLPPLQRITFQHSPSRTHATWSITTPTSDRSRMSSATAKPTAGVSSLPTFALERYFAKYEFSAPYIAALSMAEVLALADDESKRLWDSLLLMYTESQGLPQLREEIVKQFYAPALTTDHVNVLVPQEGIFLSMNSLLTASDHVIAVSPAYQSLTAVAESVGCELSLWNCVKTSDARLVFDVAELERLVRPNTKLLVVNFPHNPTGFLPSQDEWRAIIAFCEKHDLFLFSDEMYHGLESEPSLQLPPACTLYKKAVSLSGMSKTYGMPGVRLGWIASQDAGFIKKLGALKDYTTICNAGPSEILSLIALRNKDRITKRSLDIIAANKVVVGEFMAKHASLFEYAEPVAAPMAFPRLRNHLVAEYAEKLVQSTGILILPGEMYGDETYREHFRLSLGRTNIPEILARWSEAIESEASA